MKKFIFIIALLIASISSAQVGNTLEQNLEPLLAGLKQGTISKDSIVAQIKKVIKDPALYNDAWQQLVDRLTKKDNAWRFLNDLNIDFKTFQSVNNSNSSLGFSYDFKYNYSNFVRKKNSQISNTISLKASGNVAFDRNVNPNDFLESSLNYNFAIFTGGVAKENSPEDALKLIELADKLSNITDQTSPEAMEIEKERLNYLSYTDQYFFALNPRFSFESNQDFTQKQFIYGGDLQLGAKAWNNKTTLAALNIFDYPFALIRWATGADKSFTPYGSTIPTFFAGLDNVNPQNDPQRQAITGNLDSFNRYRLESSFKTYVGKIESQKVFFTANIRYYKEIDASAAIKAANLDEHFYFVGALRSSSGFYVSYVKGKLPFDAIDDEVYAVGFNYKF